MTFLFGSFFILYFLLLIAFNMGWTRVRTLKRVGTPAYSEQEIQISVVIPVRNEEHTIGHLLEDVLRQNYTRFQVVVVDDHSEDNTGKVIQQYAQQDSRIVVIKGSAFGKKQALTEGILLAAGDIIVTTDGDCQVTADWIANLRLYFHDENIKMVFGGVKMRGTSFFSKIQSMEFASLIGSGAATAALGAPVMCNGANLAFRRSVFEEVGGYSGNFHIASGDDDFLMRKIFEKYPKGIAFASQMDAVVTTDANASLNEFIQQRIRWAGKWRLHKSLTTKALAVIVIATQASFVVLPLLMWSGLMDPVVATSFWICKVALEFVFLRRVLKFLQLSWNWPAFLILQLIYPFYVIAIGVLANYSAFEWKGRKLTSLTVSSR